MADTIPLLWGHPDDEPYFDPKQFLEYYLENRGLSPVTIPENLLVTFTGPFFREAAALLGIEDEECYGVKIYRRPEGALALRNLGMGAPAAAARLEELIALGARHIIALGSGGALQPDLEIGQVVVVDRAIRDEGTSFHYLEPSWEVEAERSWIDRVAQTLKSSNLKVRVGATWTTDAPYRETRRKIKRFSSEGVLTVDMEAAALLAVGKARHVELAAVFVVSDSLAGDQWHPNFFDEELLAMRRPVLEALSHVFVGVGASV